ncbi:restriction endonuclease subunit S [Nocardia cyriacigeorgica]|uniref:restriction endonuclease subunit S n=1 Tax=Nocardia cyriacigeorgica TaxID=135487 RepID=UPI002455FFB4|nr:restriction endonuclease subunit S [Nocardia cyriacigeorgica]
MQTAKLADMAAINPRLSTPLDNDELVSFLKMADVDAERGTTSAGITRRYSEVSTGYTQFTDGDILVAKITPCFENGKVAQAKIEHQNGSGSTEFHVIRPNRGVLDARYLLHFLRQNRIRIEGERRMTGSAGQRRVPSNFLANLEVPQPSLAAQRRIAEVLDQVDALREKRRKSIALLDDLAQSIFLDMFGDPVLNPYKWPTQRTCEIGTVTTGNTPPRTNESLYGDELEWIKSDNIIPSEVYLTPSVEKLSSSGEKGARIAVPGSILVTCIAGSPNSIGNAAIAERRVAFNQQINALTPRTADTTFLYMQLRVGKRLVQNKSTGGMKGLVSKSRFEAIKLITPPIEMQRSFSARFDRLYQTRAAHRAHEHHLDTLFSSLQSRAFRGELWQDDLKDL